MKYLIISDIPTPWREKVFEKVHTALGNDFHVLYCGQNEKRRLWKFERGNHPSTFLPSVSIHINNRGERFFNIGIFKFLLTRKPQNTICFGLFPTIFISYFLLKLIRSNIGILSDSWRGREKGISWDQKFARKLIYRFFPKAFVGASKQTLNHFKQYNRRITRQQLFLSHLCADNDFFHKSQPGDLSQRKYDIMFAGRIVDIKNPLFFAKVAVQIKSNLGKCNVLIIGDGEDAIKNEMFKIFDQNNINYDFAGFIPHSKLPDFYNQSKLLLFPTSGDCWGVVINEAFLCGLPVLSSDMTAAAGELIIDNRNGFILPLDHNLWAEKASFLLSDHNILHSFSSAAQSDIQTYTFDNAAKGLIAAFEYLEFSN